MPNPDHLAILKEGVAAWNAWREENPGVKPDLSQLDFRGEDLQGANLSDANLHMAIMNGVNLREAKLTRSKLSGSYINHANLAGANLGGARLARTRLIGADLSQSNLLYVSFEMSILNQANLTGSALRYATFLNATLRHADLTDAELGKTIFFESNLSNVRGLDTCHHLSSSNLDHETLARSGYLPIEFLRGCGLSDWEIEAARLTQENLSTSQITDIGYEIIRLRSDPAIQFHSCFISYSSKNEDFARKLHDDLQEAGVRCWFAPEDLKIGDRFRNAIEDAVRLHDKLLLILSKESIKSQWVQDEVEAALEKERRRKETVLFPIQIDSATQRTRQAWASKLRRQRHIGDFRAWKDHDSYQVSFERLLRDLKATP